MQTMKAAVVREFGRPLQIEEVAVPDVAQIREGRRPRGRTLASHGLRPLRTLHHRLGNAVRPPADDRLHGERRLRRIRAGRSRLYRPAARQRGVHRDRPCTVRRGHGLQGLEGSRLQAGRLGGDIGRGWPRASCPAVRKSHGLSRGGRRYSRWTAGTGKATRR